MKLKIYVFRHGQTTFNRDKKFTGFKNPNLTKLGVKQAKIVSKKLKNKKFQVAFYTRLSRSKDTLNEVLNYHPECARIAKDDRMIERSYGTLAGKSHQWIIDRYGLEQYNKWHRGYFDRPPKGESFADVEKRVKSFINDVIKFMKKEKVNVAVSASGNSIRLFRKIMEKASEKEASSWSIPYDNYYEYDISVSN